MKYVLQIEYVQSCSTYKNGQNVWTFEQAQQHSHRETGRDCLPFPQFHIRQQKCLRLSFGTSSEITTLSSWSAREPPDPALFSSPLSPETCSALTASNTPALLTTTPLMCPLLFPLEPRYKTCQHTIVFNDFDLKFATKMAKLHLDNVVHPAACVCLKFGLTTLVLNCNRIPRPPTSPPRLSTPARPWATDSLPRLLPRPLPLFTPPDPTYYPLPRSVWRRPLEVFAARTASAAESTPRPWRRWPRPPDAPNKRRGLVMFLLWIFEHEPIRWWR